MSGSSSTMRILLIARFAPSRGRLGPKLDGDGSGSPGAVHGQDEGERAAPAERALHLHAAAVGLHDVLDEGEPEPAALRLVHERVLRAVELLEDLLLVGLRHADA